jgi:uncharacterized protein YaiI (UPF0178 family)
MRIYLDADAFPKDLKEILFRTVERKKIPLIMVAGKFMRSEHSEHITNISVPGGVDAADDKIAELTEPGDLVITSDIPLADRVVSKGGIAISPRGELYTSRNIKERLATRDLLTELRNNGLISGGPPSFNTQDRAAFANQLDRILTKHCKPKITLQ